MLFNYLSLAALLNILSLPPTLSQSPSSFPPHCLPSQPSDPNLDAQSCAIALNQFDSDHFNSPDLFSTDASVPNSIPLPYTKIYADCELRIELLYEPQVNRSVHDVWAQGQVLNTDCVMGESYLGGRIFVDEAGLGLSLRPVGMGDWDARFNAGSVVPGGSEEAKEQEGLVQVTGRRVRSF